MSMFLSFKIFRYLASFFILFSLSIQLAFAQQIVGKWKCSQETLLEMGLGYTNIKGKCLFKKDGTFYITIKGRSLLGHDFWKYRTMYAKAKGKYILDGNSITTKVCLQDIHVYVEPGMEDPELNTKEGEADKRTTWDSASRKYETVLFHCEVQEQTIKDKMFDFWNWNNSSFSFIGTKALYIGCMIELKK